MRLSHSIYEGKVSSAVMLGKLGSYARNNSVAKALKKMGKIEKTIFILEYALDAELRKRIQVGLNKGEAMNNPDADEKLLKHVSPLNWEHINFLGSYALDFETKYEEDNLRKLNI